MFISFNFNPFNFNPLSHFPFITPTFIFGVITPLSNGEGEADCQSARGRGFKLLPLFRHRTFCPIPVPIPS